MTADTRDPAAAERYEHAVRMALEAWDLTVAPAIRELCPEHWDQTSADDFVAGERSGFERAVRERLAQSAQVYEAAIHEARHD